MKADGDRPLVGSGRGELGVRLPGGMGKPDVTPDEANLVHPGRGGMSVSPSLRQLPYFLIPRRLDETLGLRGAKAPNDWCVWRMGIGPFIGAAVGPDLFLRPDGDDHGLLEPSRVMLASDYQTFLGGTRDAWVIDEA
ncbi:hypothetical protein [Polyangium aurulentum]|uniref:hypothetical protein n=1 Tax=Polyangium aurulentum TaxID=2567896 RepID=UPI0010AE0D06|nr:hypothetical protein [Polyangium aurulentum]UQA54985.1 hypothetical protein E8A73_026905 [Polyangium aurulentum]